MFALALASPAFATDGDRVKALAQSAGFIVRSNLYRKPAPDFELTNADGSRFSLRRDLKGKPAVLYMFVPG